jgi:transposase-like protein
MSGNAKRKRRSFSDEVKHSAVALIVKQVHLDSNQIYGSHKIAKQLKQTPGLETACRNTV